MVATANPRRDATRPQVRTAPLRVVRSDPRSRTVGTMGTAIVLLMFAMMFAVAGVHALSVQTQAEVDAVRAENITLEAIQTALVAELSWIDSPEGLVELVVVAGLVPAANVVNLVPVPDGELPPPQGSDPFGAGGG